MTRTKKQQKIQLKQIRSKVVLVTKVVVLTQGLINDLNRNLQKQFFPLQKQFHKIGTG